MPKMPHVYINIFEDGAQVWLTYKQWNEIFPVLMNLSPDGDFFPQSQNSANNFRKWDIIAAGELCIGMYDLGYGILVPSNTKSLKEFKKLVKNEFYYPCSTVVRSCHKNKGYGLLLYKALLLSAIKLSKLRKQKQCLFGPHIAVGGNTAECAKRMYNSLLRKRYLQKTDYTYMFLPGKIPKNIKPIYINYDG